MEKPEWFQEVDALDGAAESVLPVRAQARTARLTQGFALLGVAAVIAAGGYAFQQTGIGTSSNDALASTSAAASSAPITLPSSVSKSTPVAATTGGSTAAIAPSTGVGPVSISGGKPSITGAAAAGGDDGND